MNFSRNALLSTAGLAVAGQQSGCRGAGRGGTPSAVYEVTTGGVPVANAPTAVNGIPSFNGSYHLALDGSNTILYTMCNGECGPVNGVGNLTRNNLTGGGLNNGVAGTNITVTGGSSQDVRGLIFDPVNNTWPDDATGTFGTVTFSGTTATLNQLLTNVPAHGLTFDPFTNDIFFSEGDQIGQFDPTTSTLLTTLTVPGLGNAFDQSAADGKGHLFVASNNGVLVGLDYSATKNIGTGTVAQTFLQFSLDDIAPLSGSGANGAPEPASLALLALGLAGLGFSRRRH